MPLRIPTTLPGTDGLYDFVGVNLRRDKLDIGDSDMARAINVDFHSKIFSARLRAGRAKLNATPYAGQLMAIDRVNGKRYIMTASAAYRDATLLALNQDAQLSSIASYRPLGDTATWAFLANRAAMLKDDGFTTTNWGLATPTATPAVAVGTAGALTGSFKFEYTYLRKVGTAIACESNPSPVSAAVTPSAQRITITGLTDSTDSQVTHKRLYRTLNAGGIYLFDQDVAVGTTTATSNTLDVALGSQALLDNAPPPLCGWAVEFQGSFFFMDDPLHPDYIWFSKHFQPENVPSGNFLQVGSPYDPVRSAVPLLGLLGAFSLKTKYRVFGNASAGYTYLEATSKRGTPAPRAVVGTDEGALFVARDGFFTTDFLSADTLLSGDIQPLWDTERRNDYAPIDWTRTNEMAVAAWHQRYYFTYPTTDGDNMVAVYSRDTGKWYFYQYSEPVTAFKWEHDTGLLLGGTRTGLLTNLELAATGDDDGNIALVMESKQKAFGDALTKTLFQFFRIDLMAGTESVAVDFLIDDVVRHRQLVTGNRTRLLYRFPDNIMGNVWGWRATYTGKGQIAIYNVEVKGTNLQYS